RDQRHNLVSFVAPGPRLRGRQCEGQSDECPHDIRGDGFPMRGAVPHQRAYRAPGCPSYPPHTRLPCVGCVYAVMTYEEVPSILATCFRHNGGRPIAHTLSRVKSGGGAAPLLTSAEPSACTEASRRAPPRTPVSQRQPHLRAPCAARHPSPLQHT